MDRQTNDTDLKLALHNRFERLWRRCAPNDDPIDAQFVYPDMVNRYAIPSRIYHNSGHLVHCLGEFDAAKHLIPHAEAVEMALWYHDAVYTPGRTDNEQQSAELFRADSGTWFTAGFKAKVENLILATQHKAIPKDEDERFVVDIDLSSFGREWRAYLVDTDNIRREQQEVPDRPYFEAHTRFLESLLTRKSIFYTDFFFRRYEQIALQNITRLLAVRKIEGYG